MTKISFVQVYLHIQAEYGWALAFQQGFIVFTLFCSVSIGCGFDWTFSFLWLEGDTGLEWIQQMENKTSVVEDKIDRVVEDFRPGNRTGYFPS